MKPRLQLELWKEEGGTQGNDKESLKLRSWLQLNLPDAEQHYDDILGKVRLERLDPVVVREVGRTDSMIKMRKFEKLLPLKAPDP